jgi:hypothetical protein
MPTEGIRFPVLGTGSVNNTKIKLVSFSGNEHDADPELST